MLPVFVSFNDVNSDFGFHLRHQRGLYFRSVVTDMLQPRCTSLSVTNPRTEEWWEVRWPSGPSHRSALSHPSYFINSAQNLSYNLPKCGGTPSWVDLIFLASQEAHSLSRTVIHFPENFLFHVAVNCRSTTRWPITLLLILCTAC